MTLIELLIALWEKASPYYYAFLAGMALVLLIETITML
jgi:hypothetical protein